MKIKIEIKPSKVLALKNMALISLARLKEINLEKYPSNSLTDFYDIIHKLLEAMCLKNCIKFKGDGAHLELINYVCKKYNFSEYEINIIQSLREYRNRISYEGFMVQESYIEDNKNKFYLIIEKLFLII